MTLLHQLAAWLQQARQVAVLTGAGVSAESGLATFREAQTGLWAQYSPEDLATPEAFRRNPGLVWDWYAWRRQQAAAAQPNPAHLALARLETLVPQFSLISQNVDGLHARAGSRNLIELHGSLRRVRCSVEGTTYQAWDDTTSLPPTCPACGAWLRPDVVWFGEALPAAALTEAWQAAQQCDLFLAIGTSGLVEPAASLPRVAYAAGAQVAVINLDVTDSREARVIFLHARAGACLPELLSITFPEA
ncbi:MAG: SIR2 family NAD-dependent protein deacylase [Oscillochloridaceae bacterium umkhey_bin13]